MASISFGTFKLFGHRHLGKVSWGSRLGTSTFSYSVPTLCRSYASVRTQNVLNSSHNTRKSFLRPSHALPSLAFTRYYSKDASTPTPTTTPTTTPTPTPTGEASTATPVSESLSGAIDGAPTVVEAVSSNLDPVHTPLQYGDLAALDLCHWTPAGIAQWTMEVINTTVHLPWFWTIVAGTVFWRVVTIPFSAMALRNSSRLLPYQGELLKVSTEMKEANQKGDNYHRQKAAMKMRAIYDKAGVNPLLGFVGPLVQLPVSLGLFFGIKRMCTVPVEQMKWSGLDMIPDLTIPDPTYILPALMVALVNVQISFGATEIDVKNRPVMAHVMNGFRVLTILGFGVTASLPAAVTLSIVTATVCLLFQTLAFQCRPIRRWLGVQELPEKQKLPSMMESMNWVIESMRKRVAEAKRLGEQQNQRARASDQMKRFQEARRRK